MNNVSKIVQPEFGQRIRQRRQHLGLSQREVAGEHMTPSYVSLLESGSRIPTLDVIIHLARALQMSPQELTGRSLINLMSGDVRSDTPGNGVPSSGISPLVAQALIRSAVEADDLPTAADLTLRLLADARQGNDQEWLLRVGIEAHSLLRAAGRNEERLDLLTELAGLDAVERSAQLRVMLLTDLASAQRDADQIVEARRTVESLLPLVQEEALTGSPEHVHVLGVLISILCEIGDTDEVPGFVEQMLTMAAQIDRPGLIGRAHWTASIAYAQLGDHEQAYAQLTSARRALASPTMPLADWLRFCRTAANVLLTVERVDDALEWIEEAEGTARRIGLPAEQATVLALRAKYETATGNLEHALVHYKKLVAPDSPVTGLDLVRIQMSLATVLQGLGRRVEAIELLREAAKRCEQMGAYQLAVQVWRRIDDLRD
jgi:transcriptional regulator with XRE-family HTH domain